MIHILSRLRFLAHFCCSNPTLDFIAAPALAPAEVSVDANLMAVYEAELKRVCFNYRCLFGLIFIHIQQAEAVPLPDDDDDL